MKCKIFHGNPGNVESKINEWLKESSRTISHREMVQLLSEVVIERPGGLREGAGLDLTGGSDQGQDARRVLVPVVAVTVWYEELPPTQVEAQHRREQGDLIKKALGVRVDEFDLSVRSASCLQNAGIEYIWQLVEKTEAEMYRTKKFGRKSINELKEHLKEYGLSLGMSRP